MHQVNSRITVHQFSNDAITRRITMIKHAEHGKKQSDSLIAIWCYYGNIFHGYIEKGYIVSLLQKYIKIIS